jgi:tryptophanyl-tRNA synthetase
MLIKLPISDNELNGAKDVDKGITMGLFNYPILMAADILMFRRRHSASWTRSETAHRND